MRIVKILFIKRPMKWQYIISIFLEIPILICFISNIPQVFALGCKDKLYNHFFYILYNKSWRHEILFYFFI
ncbi:Uncharacterised protein [Streptococcus pneumoniae]|nr:Uncharacterised protein [Streptococcus pneumoniae]